MGDGVVRVTKCCLVSSSSVGLAKAALEAINGFNLFGSQVSKRQWEQQTSVIFLITCVINPAIH